MERLRISGGTRLSGTVRIGGAKNSALKLMAASLLAQGRTTLDEVPDILDVRFMGQLLDRLGCRCQWADEPGSLTIDVPAEVTHEADYDLVRRLRASIVVLGPLLARCGQARVALPGGDRIGSRGLDMHIGGLARLGAKVRLEHGYVVAEAPDGLRGAMLALDFPSVGATENLLMAGVLARGTTIIDNAAREPEVVDLADMLSRMGAKVGGAGTSTLEIEGQEGLSPVRHATLPDRIVAGTWAIGAVLTQGDVWLERARPPHLEALLDKLAATGASVSSDGATGFGVRMDRRPRAVDVITLPYPGFATDLQPMMVTLAAVSEGTAMVTENLYDGRFGFVQELARLGADIRTDGHHAIVRGRSGLSGAPVVASDIRAGAALVLAGMVADGETIVSGLAHIDRGYPALTQTLTGLGASVVREPDDIEPD